MISPKSIVSSQLRDAGVLELDYNLVLNTRAVRHAGSKPVARTNTSSWIGRRNTNGEDPPLPEKEDKR